jgi:hypothetical protein
LSNTAEWSLGSNRTRTAAVALLVSLGACNQTSTIEGDVFWRTHDGQPRVAAGSQIAVLPMPNAIDSILGEMCARQSSLVTQLAQGGILAPLEAQKLRLQAQLAALRGAPRVASHLTDSSFSVESRGKDMYRSLDSLHRAQRAQADTIAAHVALARAVVDLHGHYTVRLPRGDSVEFIVMALADSPEVAIWRARTPRTAKTSVLTLDKPTIRRHVYCGEK